ALFHRVQVNVQIKSLADLLADFGSRGIRTDERKACVKKYGTDGLWLFKGHYHLYVRFCMKHAEFLSERLAPPNARSKIQHVSCYLPLYTASAAASALPGCGVKPQRGKICSSAASTVSTFLRHELYPMRPMRIKQPFRGPKPPPISMLYSSSSPLRMASSSTPSGRLTAVSTDRA